MTNGSYWWVMWSYQPSPAGPFAWTQLASSNSPGAYDPNSPPRYEDLYPVAFWTYIAAWNYTTRKWEVQLIQPVR